MGSTDDDNEAELPTLLMLGTGDPLCAALEEALGGYATFVEAAPSEAATSSVLAAAPDLVVLLGDAAEDAERILRELTENAATSVVPVAILSEDASLDARLRFSRHGAVAVVPKSASLDEMARRIAALAQELPERSGSMLGEVGEASVDELVELLSAEVKSGILSIAPAGAEKGARVVLRSGRPVAEAIAAFVARIRPLVESSEPLRYEFHESPTGRLDVLDADTVGDTNPDVLEGRRVLVVEESVARADMLAQELRAAGAQVVLTDGEGAGLERARALDPDLLLVNQDGLDGWAYGVMSKLRRDAGLRWASVLVVREEELWAEEGAPPRIDRLIAGVGALLAPDVELTERARTEKRFELRLETLGPVRTLRALLRAEQTMHLTIRHPRAMVEVDLAEGLVAGVEATFMGDASRSLAGPEALATLLVLSTGRIRAERRDRPAAANLLAPLEDAVAAARQETPPLKPSLPPPAPARPAGTTPGDASENADASALVSRLEGLLARLEDKLPAESKGADSEAPTATRKAALPRIPPPPRVPKPLAPPPPVAPPPVVAPRAKTPGTSRKAVADAKLPITSLAALNAASPGSPLPTEPTQAGAAGPTHSESAERVAVGVPAMDPDASDPPAIPAPPASLLEPSVADPSGAAEAAAAIEPFAVQSARAPEPPTDAAVEAMEPLTLPRSGPSPKLLLGLFAALLLLGVGFGVYAALGSDTAGADASPADPNGGGAVAAANTPPAQRSPTAVAPDTAAPDTVTPDAGQVANAAPDAGAAVADAPDAGLDAAADDLADAGAGDLGDESDLGDAGTDDHGDEEAMADENAGDEEALELPADRAGRIRELLRAGNFQRHQGRLRVAEARYRAVLRLDRGNGRALAGLARVDLATHRTAEAVRWARRLVRAHPQQASNRVLLGDALTASGDRAGARRAYQAALRKDPHNRAARRRLGR